MLKFFKWIAGLFKAKPEEVQIPKPPVPVVDVLPEKIVQPEPEQPVVELVDAVDRPFRRVVKKSKKKFETSYIKIFGMPRTGTTFLRALCFANFKNVRVFTNTFGWKHGQPLSTEEFEKWPERYQKGSKEYERYRGIVSETKDGNKIKFIIVIKNPYSWYYSIRRYRRAHFDMAKLPEEYQIYSNRYRDYKDLYESVDNDTYGAGCIVMYEDLIENPVSTLKDISREFDIELKSKSVTIPVKVEQSRLFNEKQRKFYLSGGNFKLTQYLVDIINGNVDWVILNFFGYGKVVKGE